MTTSKDDTMTTTPIKTKAAPEQLRYRLGLRSSNAAAKHRSPVLEARHPGKGNRKNWKREVQR